MHTPFIFTEENTRGNIQEPGIAVERAALNHSAAHRDDERPFGVPFTLPPAAVARVARPEEKHPKR